MPKLKVGQVMSREVFFVERQDPLTRVCDLMSDHDIRHVPVVDSDHQLVGIISHRDLLRRSLIEQADYTLSMERDRLTGTAAWEVMNSPVLTVDPETHLAVAAQLLLDNKVGCLPVTEGDAVVGILTEADFVRLHTSDEAPGG